MTWLIRFILWDCLMSFFGVIHVVVKLYRSCSWYLIFLPTTVVMTVYRTLRNEVVGRHRKCHDDEYCQSFLEKIVNKHGFMLEVHRTTASDGQELVIHRVYTPNEQFGYKKHNSPTRARRVAFVQHGLKMSSADWLVGPSPFGIMLADAGFDVWMGNFRGNRFSRVEADNWDFSWDEHGSIDLPAMITYVKSATKVRKMTFFAHSMGTTSFFVMMHTFPDMSSYFTRCVALAPVINIANVHGMPSWFLNAADAICRLLNFLGIYRIEFDKRIPGYTSLAILIVFAMGYHDFDLNEAQDILALSPASCSTTHLRHFIMCRRNNTFASKTSLPYDLGKVTCPVQIWYSPNDWAAGTVDALSIAQQLPNVEFCNDISVDDFGHLDFLWSKRSRLVFDKVLEKC